MENKDYIKTIENAERRTISSVSSCIIEKRAETEVAVIEGYAALFNSRTDLGWFHEEILPGAFDNVLNDDVRCLFNHDPNLILARCINGVGTLKLSVDATGLKYSYETSNISYAKDLVISIERGDVNKSSFAFSIGEESWEYLEGEKKDVRKIIKFSKLYDVSPVTYPAYQDTSVAKRSFESIKKIAFSAVEMAKKRLEIFKF